MYVQAFEFLSAFLSKGAFQLYGKSCLTGHQDITAAADGQDLGFFVNLKPKLCSIPAPKLSPGFSASDSPCEFFL